MSALTRVDQELAGRIAAAMTEFHPQRFTEDDVIEIALGRGLLGLAHEYKVRYGTELWDRASVEGIR